MDSNDMIQQTTTTPNEHITEHYAKASQPDNIFFSLDIGTRSVIGTVGMAEDDIVRIIDVEAVEHPKRAMIDGQIEDIAQVAKIAKIVKTRLEERLGYSLERVNVAAAGRALKTYQSVGEVDLDRSVPIDNAAISRLEMNAITAANDAILKNADRTYNTQFYCVGYSVMKYYLDDYALSTLFGHKGEIARVEMIVTFLPNEVVESLYSTMSLIDLQIESLTLEPIAAMNAVIPPELRILNLALVDIGAGTSDIAISNEGSVVAYAMATVAGDEITEALTQKYLVDFETAERIKHDLSIKADTISFNDILGNDYDIDVGEIAEVVKPSLEHLCSVICEKILEVNGKAPSAVFLVGGASKIPLLCDYMAKTLDIDPKKVAVGGKPLKKMVVTDCDVFTPEFATPIGIVITAANSRSTDDLVMTINGEKTSMFRKAGITVMDLMLASGYRYSQMIGTNGKSLIFTLNNEKKVIRGGFPTPAVITVNSEPTSLFMPVNGGDDITIIPAVSGADVTLTLHDILKDFNQFYVTVNDDVVSAGTNAMVNGQQSSLERVIKSRDIIKTYDVSTLSDLCEHENINTNEFTFTINGELVDIYTLLKPNDSIRFAPIKAQEDEQENTPVSKSWEYEESEFTKSTSVSTAFSQNSFVPEIMEDAEEIIAKPAVSNIESYSPKVSAPSQNSMEGKSIEEINAILNKERDSTKAYNDSFQSKSMFVNLNGKTVELAPKADKTPYLFLDMLNFVNIDTSKPEGTNIILRLNDEEASYLMEIHNGDIIEILWEK